MSERPTPETDDQPTINAINDDGYAVPCVDIDFARRLERERDEWYFKAHENFKFTLDARAERDEAREAAERWESSSDAMERAGAEQARRADENREWALKAERERDEAREALAEAWRFADQWLALADGYLKRINEIQNDIQKN